MQKIIPNIAVEDCRQALEFYRKVFGGEIRNVQTADGKPMFEGHEGKIVHAELHINGDCILYLNDVFEDRGGGGRISLVLQLASEDEIRKLFDALSQQGNVVFPLQKTFWGSHHAVVTDRHGTTWSLDYAGR